MPIITIGEIVDLILMTIFVGYIFSDIIPVRRDSYDPLTHYRRGFDFEALKFAILATAPAIIVHEMAHKFMALGFGLSATFFAFGFNPKNKHVFVHIQHASDSGF